MQYLFANIFAIYFILQIYSLRQTIYIANILDNIFVIYIANILYNIFAIYCLFQIKMIYDKPIRQYVWYIYFANILYNIFAIPICKCNSKYVFSMNYFILQIYLQYIACFNKNDKWQPYTTIYLQYLCKCIGQYICSKYIVFNIKYFILQIYCLLQTRWISQKPISNNYYCVLQIYIGQYICNTQYFVLQISPKSIKQYICNTWYCVLQIY